MVSLQREAQSVVAQVVSQGLSSMRKCTKSGNRVVFDSESYIENKATGKII